MRKNPARARSFASPSGKRLPASMRSRPARIRGRKARAASMALVAVLLVAIGPPALPHGRDRSVSHVGLGMAGLGGGIAAGSPDMLIAIRGGFFDRQIAAADSGQFVGTATSAPYLIETTHQETEASPPRPCLA